MTLLGQGTPFEIKDTSRLELPPLLKEMGLKVGAEIGVYKGDFTKVFCENGMKMYAIDPWLAYPEYYHLKADQTQMENEYERAKKKLMGSDCEIIRKTSMEAVKDFKDGSLDFVYIDGNHDLMHATEDIWEWSKKVRKGGVVSGHDYWNGNHMHLCDVGWVVDSYTKSKHIRNWYTFGIKDRKLSWLWIQ